MIIKKLTRWVVTGRRIQGHRTALLSMMCSLHDPTHSGQFCKHVCFCLSDACSHSPSVSSWSLLSFRGRTQSPTWFRWAQAIKVSSATDLLRCERSEAERGRSSHDGLAASGRLSCCFYHVCCVLLCLFLFASHSLFLSTSPSPFYLYMSFSVSLSLQLFLPMVHSLLHVCFFLSACVCFCLCMHDIF